MKNGIKQDINFLDKPLWFQSLRDSKNEPGTTTVWKDVDGYIYKTSELLPDKVDMLILLYLLYCSQNNSYNVNVSLSRYKLLKACGFSTNNRDYYARVEESLIRWASVCITFTGSFYGQGNRENMIFHIIDTGFYDPDTKRIEVRFNKEWITKIKESEFFKYVDFEYYKALRTPAAMRLFEILSKSFAGRDKWKIKLIALGDKMTIRRRKTKKGPMMYASDVLAAIKPAIKIINQKAESRILAKAIGSKNLFRIEYSIVGAKQSRVIIFTKLNIDAKQNKVASNIEKDKQIANTSQAPKTTQIAPDNCYNWLVSIKYVGKATAIRLLALPGAKNWQEIKAEYERQHDKIRRAPAWLTTAFSENYKATAEKENKKTRAEQEIERYERLYASLIDTEKASYKEEYEDYLNLLPAPIRAEYTKNKYAFINWFGAQIKAKKG